MANPSKAKGTKAEVAVERYLRSLGLDADRRPPRGVDDEGDVWCGEWALEVKAAQTYRTPEWWTETMREAAIAEKRPLLVVKPRGVADPAKYWAICDLRTFAKYVLL